MYQQGIETFQEYLKGHGLNIHQANEYLRNLDQKVFINPALPEHKAVESYVASFVDRLLQEIHDNVVPGFELRIIPSGSYYSSLRVGRPYEFDFMLKIPTERISVKRQRPSLFFEVRLEDEDEFQWAEAHSDGSSVYYEDGEGIVLDISEMMVVLETVFRTGIDTIEGEFNVKQYGRLGSGPAYQVIIMYLDQPVLLDLVPCFEFPWSQHDEIPEMSEKVLDLVCHISKTNPQKFQQLTGFTKHLTCPLTTKRAKEIVHQSLYLVFDADPNYARLSTSVLERLIFLTLHDDLLAILRVVKYLVQTFHIPIDGYSPHYMSHSTKYGLPALIKSRHLTTLFLRIILRTPTECVQQPQEEYFSWGVFSVLKDMQARELSELTQISIRTFFPMVDNGSVIGLVESPTSAKSRFHFINLGTIVNFLLKCICENALEGMSLECVQNHVKCQECWGDVNEILDEIFGFDNGPLICNYPVELCYLHKHLQKQLCYVQDDSEKTLCYTREH